MVFPRQHRLAKKSDFQNVYQSKSKLSNGSLILLYLDNHLPYSRLGIVISKEKVRLAVKRNFVRRIIRESYRQHSAKIKGFDMVILLRQSYTLDRVKLRMEADTLFQRLISK